MSPQDSEALPAYHLDPDKRLEELLRASRAIEIERLPLSSVKLSKFTLKQLSREHPIRPVKRKKQHYNTRRKKAREKSHSENKQYLLHKSRKGEAWQVSREEWGVLWDYIGGCRYRLGRYSEDEPYSVENLWIESKDGKKLWEGYEDRLRRLGMLL